MSKAKTLNRVNPLFLKGIAHRGLHNEEFCENSTLAFKHAIENGFAFELDVHLTKDHEIVVFHDSKLKRITGKDGIIEELTLNEIKENYSLSDCTKIPTLKEVLDLTNEQVPIVVELKSYLDNYKELANKTSEVLSCIKDKRNIIIISFDPRALVCMKKSGFVRQFLSEKGSKFWKLYKLRFLFEGVDLSYASLDDPKVAKYCKTHFSNIWTVDSEKIFNRYASLVDTVTFQNIPIELVKEFYKNK